MQQQQQMQQQQLEAQAKEKAAEREFEMQKSQAEIQKDITVAEIRSAGYGAQVDINQNLQSDYQDALKDIRQRDQYREQMNFKREQAAIKNSDSKEKINIERERLATQRDIADKNLQIARENKNKYDVNSSNTEEE